MKIAILTGGETGERDISMASAQNIQSLLDFADSEVFILPEDLQRYLDSHADFDLAIPMIHGKGGEDGTIQKILDGLNIPYLFSGIAAHAIGIDKKKAKETVSALGYAVANEMPADDLRFPLFAKPRFGGSSLNAGLYSSAEELEQLRKQTAEELILEEPLTGREFTVGVIEYDRRPMALPVIEIVAAAGTFFDFEQKYTTGKMAREICPADISPELSKQLQSIAVAAHTEIGARHMTRSDFIVTKDGKPYFLEINTIPGMTNNSLIPKMVTAAGLNISKLFQEWSENFVSKP